MSYNDTNSIGQVTEVTGKAIIIRTDGTEEAVTMGTEVFQGDIIETSGDAAVNVGFIDDSSFALSDNARVAMDEFVFDPETEAGAQDFSVMQGVFVYTSGLIGRENPDSVEIDTPVGSIGIRGTIIGGKIDPQGDSQITVIEGAIVVQNDAGEQLLTNQFDTVLLGGKNVAPSAVQTLDVTDVANDYGAVKGVSAELFSSFNDIMQQQGPAKGVNDEFGGEGAEAPLDVQSDEGDEGKSGDSAQQAPKLDVKNDDLSDKLEEFKASSDRFKNRDQRDADEVQYDQNKVDDWLGVNNQGLFFSRAPGGQIDDPATMQAALENQYQAADGIIPIGVAGARILKLDINDPQGEIFSPSDFRFAGTLGNDITKTSNFLEIELSNNEYYLKLKNDVTMTDMGGYYDLLSVSTGSSIQFISAVDTLDVKVGFSDGQPITKDLNLVLKHTNSIQSFGSVTSSTNKPTYDETTPFITGTENDDHFEVTHGSGGTVDFELINGGSGIDHMYLKGNTGHVLYNFSDGYLNPGNNARELSSIEHIFFNDAGHDVLKIDIQTITNLLKTSDLAGQSSLIQGPYKEIVIHTNDTNPSDGLNNDVFFHDGSGGSTNLVSNGFEYLGTETRGAAGDYAVYHNQSLNAAVAIEATIDGANTVGGL